MGVQVQIHSHYEGIAATEKFPNATGWHVDEHGRLHIRGNGGNIATFHASSWDFVSEMEVVEYGTVDTHGTREGAPWVKFKETVVEKPLSVEVNVHPDAVEAAQKLTTRVNKHSGR